MHFTTFEIQNAILRPYVQYILFNRSQDQACKQEVVSFTNTNACLGVCHGGELVRASDGTLSMQPTERITSYLSGMYLKPHRFRANGILDEICIDFTPLGYYQFIKIPMKQYLLAEDVLREAFGHSALGTFEHIFDTSDLYSRAQLIEAFLLTKMQTREDNTLRQVIQLAHTTSGNVTVEKIAKNTGISARTLHRLFTKQFSISPKSYLRIAKFRCALVRLFAFPEMSLTEVCYASGYYDQSHFIKDFNAFTATSPKSVRKSLHSVNDLVYVSV